MDRRALRFVKRMGAEQRRRIYNALACLAQDPYRPRPGCDIRSLKGKPGVRALRIGDLRACYEIVGQLVHVTVIAHRKNAYDR